jgi:hypothetical protein
VTCCTFAPRGARQKHGNTTKWTPYQSGCFVLFSCFSLVPHGAKKTAWHKSNIITLTPSMWLRLNQIMPLYIKTYYWEISMNNRKRSHNLSTFKKFNDNTKAILKSSDCHIRRFFLKLKGRSLILELYEPKICFSLWFMITLFQLSEFMFWTSRIQIYIFTKLKSWIP